MGWLSSLLSCWPVSVAASGLLGDHLEIALQKGQKVRALFTPSNQTAGVDH